MNEMGIQSVANQQTSSMKNWPRELPPRGLGK